MTRESMQLKEHVNSNDLKKKILKFNDKKKKNNYWHEFNGWTMSTSFHSQILVFKTRRADDSTYARPNTMIRKELLPLLPI